MKKSVLVLFAAAIFILPSCRKVVGDGPLVTETRSTGNFTGVASGISGKVYITIGPVMKVDVTGQQNILNILNTHVVNGILKIDFKNDVRIKSHEEIVAHITMPALDYLRLSGSGNMDVQGDVVTNNLDINVSGSGNIAVEQAAVDNKINATVSGSGNIKVMDGSAKKIDLTISGSGGIEMPDVPSENATTHTSGSGIMKINVIKTLESSISGSGSVYYYGNPVISAHISGSGKLIPL
jgi:hypothetical protein